MHPNRLKMTLISSEISIDCCKNGSNTDSLKRLLSVHAYMVTWRRKFELGKKKSFTAFIYKFCVYVTSDLYMTHNSHIRFPISDIRTGVNKPFIFSTPEYTWLMCGISALSVIVFQICFIFYNSAIVVMRWPVLQNFSNCEKAEFI